MIFPSFRNELKHFSQGYVIAGCDEAGRGPVAGPVVAAACILDPKKIGAYRSKGKWYHRVRDSKTVPEEEREILVKKIIENSIAHGMGIVSPEEIDTLNIHHASLKAMRLAVLNLLEKISPGSGRFLVLVDGRFTIPDLSLPGLLLEQKSVVHGDALSLSIAAASIIAKVERDAIMRELDCTFPEYGFVRHKGYNTSEHKRALQKYGITAVHRKSFVK